MGGGIETHLIRDAGNSSKSIAAISQKGEYSSFPDFNRL